MTHLRIRTVLAAGITGIFLGIASGAISAPPVTFAGSETPFGGPIQDTQDCFKCSSTYWISVGPPKNAMVVYSPGTTKVYKYGQIFRNGPNVLGLYRSGGECKYGGRCQNSKIVQGTMTMVGSSQ